MQDKAVLPGKRVIFFDVNQTLIRQHLSFEQCFRDIWPDYSARWLQEEMPGAEELWQAYHELWERRRKQRPLLVPMEEVQQQCLKEACHRLGLPLSATMIHGLLQELRHRRMSSKAPAAGTREALEALSRKYRLAVISNSPREEVLQLLSRFGLSVYFPESFVFTPAKPADKKPSPALFKTALEALELSPRQAVMVGNSWKHDIVGAVKSGIDAVWLHGSRLSEAAETKKISRQKLGKRNVYLIRQLAQLPSLLSGP